MSHCAASRQKSKGPERNLAARLEAEVGLNRAQLHVTLALVADYIGTYYGQLRPPGAIVHTAVSAKEPPGKPIKHCKVLPVRLTYIHEADFEVLEQMGTVQGRAVRLYRFCQEARQQGALLSHEDLRVLLGVDLSTVKDLVARLKKQGLIPPTRGAVKDIGPGSSHKVTVAKMLGLGYSTTLIRSLTNHSESSISRYQHQFALVLYLRDRYPEATDEQRRQLAGLSPAAYQAYLQVACELEPRPDCRPHLARLRRRFQLDPQNIAGRPPGSPTRPAPGPARLGQQSLPTALRQTLQEGFGTTRRVAEALAEDVMGLIDRAHPCGDTLQPGHAVVFVHAHDPTFMAGQGRPDRPVIPVTVPLHTPKVQAIWRSPQPASERRGRIATHIASSIHQQGGIASLDNLAEMLHVAPTTLSADLRRLAVEVHINAPTKGLIEDAGQTLTHKDWIVALDRSGLTGHEISWLSRHAPNSRDRYIETYRRAEILALLEGAIPEPKRLARLLRLRPHVARQYIDLLRRYSAQPPSTPGSQQVGPPKSPPELRTNPIHIEQTGPYVGPNR